jgi:hypothetical protein
MSRRLIVIYQLVAGLSDTVTGALLLFVPGLTLHLMHVSAGAAALPFLSYIGAFVLSVGIAYLYGISLAMHAGSRAKLEVVWLLTALTRGLVALFVTSSIVRGSLETGWIDVALWDGLLALVQVTGLFQGWLRNAS